MQKSGADSKLGGKGRVKVGIVGVAGYTGRELLRILENHPNADISEVYGASSAGVRLGELYPFLSKKTGQLEIADFYTQSHQADFYFVCVHHGKSQEIVARLIGEGKRVVDLSADFRIKDPAIYEKVYSVRHRFVELLKKAIYGMPEIYKEKIKTADLVANPGCLARAAILSLFPLVKEELIDPGYPVIIDAKTGVSGAGRNLREDLHFPHMNENFKPYAALYHRHQPEIEQELKYKENLEIAFVPHLLPVDRGILVSSYVRLKERLSREHLLEIYNQVYHEAAFIKVLEKGYPELKMVRGTNSVYLGIEVRGVNAAVFGALDNLLSGASGTAVHNFNLMTGCPEKEGLDSLTPLYP